MEEQRETIVSEETKKAIKENVKNMFDLFAEHAKKLADSLASFNRRREEIDKEIKNGPRRTSGRIV